MQHWIKLPACDGEYTTFEDLIRHRSEQASQQGTAASNGSRPSRHSDHQIREVKHSLDAGVKILLVDLVLTQLMQLIILGPGCLLRLSRPCARQREIGRLQVIARSWACNTPCPQSLSLTFRFHGSGMKPGKVWLDRKIRPRPPSNPLKPSSISHDDRCLFYVFQDSWYFDCIQSHPEEHQTFNEGVSTSTSQESADTHSNDAQQHERETRSRADSKQKQLERQKVSSYSSASLPFINFVSHLAGLIQVVHYLEQPFPLCIQIRERLTWCFKKEGLYMNVGLH